jgi:hypothetical protein
MAQKLDPKEIVEWQEMAYSNMIQMEALLRLLVQKGVITEEEYAAELKRVAQEVDAKQGE